MGSILDSSKRLQNPVEAAPPVSDNVAAMSGFQKLALAALACAFGCEASERCTQENVDDCYVSVGCDGSESCTLNTDRMNSLCGCLTGLDCDQEWYHAYCDDAPYEEGECCFCDDEADGGCEQ